MHSPKAVDLSQQRDVIQSMLRDAARGRRGHKQSNAAIASSWDAFTRLKSGLDTSPRDKILSIHSRIIQHQSDIQDCKALQKDVVIHDTLDTVAVGFQQPPESPHPEEQVQVMDIAWDEEFPDDAEYLDAVRQGKHPLMPVLTRLVEAAMKDGTSAIVARLEASHLEIKRSVELCVNKLREAQTVAPEMPSYLAPEFHNKITRAAQFTPTVDLKRLPTLSEHVTQLLHAKIFAHVSSHLDKTLVQDITRISKEELLKIELPTLEAYIASSLGDVAVYINALLPELLHLLHTTAGH